MKANHARRIRTIQRPALLSRAGRFRPRRRDERSGAAAKAEANGAAGMRLTRTVVPPNTEG